MPDEKSDARKSFDTHYNYIDCLASLTSNVRLEFKGNLSPISLPLMGTKTNLIKLTKQSLDDELKIVKYDQDYSYASTSWLPIKSYYLIFNLMLTIEYLLSANPNSLNSNHPHINSLFTDKLNTGTLTFSQPLLNMVFDNDIFDYHDNVGANLSRQIEEERRYKLAIKKVATYKLKEYKRKNPNWRRLKGKQDMSTFRNKFNISIFEFFYFMRIRSNYRDFAFIEGISTHETANYFYTYYLSTMNIFNALERLKDNLIKIRKA